MTRIRRPVSMSRSEPAGPDGTYPERTVNWAVKRRLRELAEKGRKCALDRDGSE